MLKKTINDRDFTRTTIETYNKLRSRFGSSARISNIFDLLRTAYDIDEFLVFDQRFCQNGPFENYLMDRYSEWLKGDEVDMGEIYESILVAGDFTKSEKQLFEIGKAEERIWAMFLAITDPDNINNIKLEND